MRRARRGLFGWLPWRAVGPSRQPGSGGEWIQVNCALMPSSRDEFPPAPWEDLHGALRRWREEGRFEVCFFVRKPPGLRLRFQGLHLEERLEPPLIEWLDRAERTDAIRAFRLSVYEPETFRFGGRGGMAVAHEYFDRNTEAVLSYETLPVEDRATPYRQLVSLALSNDLMGRCVDDFDELSDIWSRLQTAPWVGEPGPPLDAGLVREALELAPSFVGRLSPGAAALLRNATADNDRVASKLRAMAGAGRLAIGVRGWLTHACVFHWNQWGLSAPLLRPMITSMLSLLRPENDA